MQNQSRSLGFWSWFHIFWAAGCIPGPWLLLVTAYISGNMETKTVLIFYLF